MDEKGRNRPSRNGVPFLKWPGGKRWLVNTILRRVDRTKLRRYFEPFLGGGAVFFALKPAKAVLSDINGKLMEVYAVVRTHHKEVKEKLARLPVDAETFYRIRSTTFDSPIDRAVRFLYLNRTCFAGMYRENRSGEFNVPFGGGERTPETLCKTDLLERVAIALESAELRFGDFEPVIDDAGKGDLVYCDPTYIAPEKPTTFRRYNGTRFAWEDQERLARSAIVAQSRGATVIVSNAATQEISSLYPTAQKIKLERASCLSRKTSGRKRIQEALFLLKPTKNS